MINTERYLQFIEANKLAQSQFLLLILLYQGRNDLIKRYKLLFPATDGSAIGQSLLDDLVRRKFLIQAKEDGAKASSYSIGETFKKAFIDKHLAIEELIDKYPGMMMKGGINYPLTLINANKYIDIYWNKINGDYHEHLLVLDDIKYMKDNNLTPGKLESFIDSKYWNKLREIKNGVLDSTSNTITFNNNDY